MRVKLQKENINDNQKIKEIIQKIYSDEHEIFNTWTMPNRLDENQPFIITIDNKCSIDLDDALAITQDQYGMTLHIYITNTTPFLIHNPNYESLALERYQTLYSNKDQYTHERYHLLPRECAENLLSLKENEIRNVIDHSFYIDYSGNVSYDISYQNVLINKNLSYEDVDEMIRKKSNSEYRDYLQRLEKGIQIVYKKLGLNKKYTISGESRAQKIVTGTSILINHMTASEAIKKQYLLLYQDYLTGKYLINNSENIYTRVSSPIRRYIDLKNNYLLNRFLNENISEKEYYQIEKELMTLITILKDKKEQNKQIARKIFRS